MTEQSTNIDRDLPLRSPEDIDLTAFNALRGPDYDGGKPVEDASRLFNKQLIIDDQTTLDIQTIRVPGFIGIADALQVTDPNGNAISGHADIVKFLEKYGPLICTYQYNKDRYGLPVDLRNPPQDSKETYKLKEILIKNEGHHSGAIVPARRRDEKNNLVDSYAAFNEPDLYHNGMYGAEGFIAVAERLVFPDFVTPEQARGYSDSIICWMAAINPFVPFAGDYNGGDPLGVVDRATLKEFLRNVALASLGDSQALAFLNRSENNHYCAEFVFVGLNSVVYPFNQQGLSLLLEDDRQVNEILAIRDRQNRRESNVLSDNSNNQEFQAFNIPMPAVPESLPPLDVLMTQHGEIFNSNSLCLPPYTVSQLIRRAFHTLLPQDRGIGDLDLAKAQKRLLDVMEPMLLQQMELNERSDDDPQVLGIRQFMAMVREQLPQKFNNYAEVDRKMDELLAKADEMLVSAGEIVYFVPPRLYVDFGQRDGDNNLPQGWGFELESVGTLIFRGAFKATSDGSSIDSDSGSQDELVSDVDSDSSVDSGSSKSIWEFLNSVWKSIWKVLTTPL